MKKNLFIALFILIIALLVFLILQLLPEKVNRYEVRKGDTFYGIYKAHASDTPYTHFKKLNQHIASKRGSFDHLQEDDVIFLQVNPRPRILERWSRSSYRQIATFFYKDEPPQSGNQISYYTRYYEIGERLVRFHVIRIPASQFSEYKLELMVGDKPGHIREIAPGAVAAINGGFFLKDGQLLGYQKSGSDVHSDKAFDYRTKAYFVVNEESSIISRTVDLSADNQVVLESYPLLIENGKIVAEWKQNRHFRSAVALKGADCYFIATDNPLFSENEITISEFADFLFQEGFDSALNLDGGSSTQIMYRDKLIQNGYRKIISVLALYKR
ncbi:MAG: phosphodiester glycosidase family protein [Candidatus Cloacimonetes bacterium]|nr:phosphodiester glycosidase family protein [Candidatus Cloacimonadota bacterium]